MFLLLLSKLVTPNNISNPTPLQTDPNWSGRPNAPYLVGQRMRPNVGAADALKCRYIECTLTGQGKKWRRCVKRYLHCMSQYAYCHNITIYSFQIDWFLPFSFYVDQVKKKTSERSLNPINLRRSRTKKNKREISHPVILRILRRSGMYKKKQARDLSGRNQSIWKLYHT